MFSKVDDSFLSVFSPCWEAHMGSSLRVASAGTGVRVTAQGHSEFTWGPSPENVGDVDLQSSGGIQVASGKEASVWWCKWWVDPEMGCSPAAHHCLRCTFAPRPLPVPLCPTSPVSSLFPHNLGIPWG